MLGHKVLITSETEQLSGIVEQLPLASISCQIREHLPIDMIFSDIVGVGQFKALVRDGYGKFSCLLRVVDSFGTEPAFNYGEFARANKLRTSWGMQNLNPRQFFTMFPHSPDNSFMGFVVEQHLNDSEISSLKKKNWAVVYGKAEYMWQGKERFLEILHQYVEIHATVFIANPEDTVVPPYVINHGILPGPELHKLLRQAKLFIGLGFPYEGPAPLEAIALGAVFINPKFDPPHSSLNTKFFQGKPTLRKVTSQHPYGEDFIGRPHVETIDPDNPEQVHASIKRALSVHNSSQFEGHLPYEFTHEGMLQRVSAYIDNQDFCNPSPPPWPPEDQVSIYLGGTGESCQDVCQKRNKTCEPSYFHQINNIEELSKHIGHQCDSIVDTHEDVLYPAMRIDTGQCVLQPQVMLYSCVGSSDYFARLCPCRTLIRGQVALCQTCSRPKRS